MKEYQLELAQLRKDKADKLGVHYEDPMELVMQANQALLKNDPTSVELQQELTNQLSVHSLGPLLDDYETTIAQLQQELQSTKFQLKS